MLAGVRERLRREFVRKGQSARSGATSPSLDPADPNVLTIGFARRFATYKRASLILRDRARLRASSTTPSARWCSCSPARRIRRTSRARKCCARSSTMLHAGVHRPRGVPRGLRHPARALAGLGLRRLAQQSDRAARGERHLGHQGRGQRHASISRCSMAGGPRPSTASNGWGLPPVDVEDPKAARRARGRADPRHHRGRGCAALLLARKGGCLARMGGALQARDDDGHPGLSTCVAPSRDYARACTSRRLRMVRACTSHDYAGALALARWKARVRERWNGLRRSRSRSAYAAAIRAASGCGCAWRCSWAGSIAKRPARRVQGAARAARGALRVPRRCASYRSHCMPRLARAAAGHRGGRAGRLGDLRGCADGRLRPVPGRDPRVPLARAADGPVRARPHEVRGGYRSDLFSEEK
jgi:hypothetical protein